MSIPRFFPYTVKLLNLLKKYEQGVGEQLLLSGVAQEGVHSLLNELTSHGYA